MSRRRIAALALIVALLIAAYAAHRGIAAHILRSLP